MSVEIRANVIVDCPNCLLGWSCCVLLAQPPACGVISLKIIALTHWCKYSQRQS